MQKVMFSILAIIALTACQKGLPVAVAPCQSNAATTGNLLNAKVTVHKNGDNFTLMLDGSIDQWYNPCNLPAQYAVDNKKLAIDAEVKQTAHLEGAPCCTEDIVISKLAER